MKRAVLCFAAGLAASVVLVAQTGQTPPPSDVQAPPQFRSTTELIRLDVSVLDRNRKPVRGLTGADFTVLENGKPQTVSAFSAVDLPDVEPPSAPWIRDVAPDVKTNSGSQQRRLFIIAIDDATIENDVAAIKSVKEIARGIVNRLGPADVASVVFTRDNRNSQDFTNDRTRLLTAVDSFTVGFRGQATAGNAAVGMPDAAGAEDLWYLSSVGVLDRAVDFLADLSERRKAIIYVGQGIPFDVGGAVTAVNATPTAPSGAVSNAALQMRIKDQMTDMFERALRANVTIYSVDACGLRQPPPPRVAGAKAPVATCVAGLEVDYLQNIAAATGGRAVVNSNDFNPGLDNVFLENSSYYLLGFASGDPAHDGKFRRVEVKVNRPGVDVRTRSGYDAPRDESSDRPRPAASPLMKALGGVVPLSDLPMQIMAAPFALTGKSATGATVAVAVGLKQPIRQMEEQNVENVDLQIAAYNTDGRSFGNSRKQAGVTIRPNAAGTAEYEIFGTIDLKPGRYQLRIAANVGSLTTAGSVYYDVDVPDFAAAPLSMSGLLISATPNPVFAPKDGFQPLVSVIPTTRRAFAPGTHTVAAFARVYQGGKAKPVAATAHLTVRDAKNAVVFERQQPLAANLFGDTRSADLKIDIPITDLATGDYVLTFEATAGTNTVHRDSRFQIVK